MRIDWNFHGFDQLRTCPQIVSQVDELAEKITDRAGRGFDWASSVRTGKRGGKRHRAIVFTDTPRAMVVNARDNTLLKALGGAGDGNSGSSDS